MYSSSAALCTTSVLLSLFVDCRTVSRWAGEGEDEMKTVVADVERKPEVLFVCVHNSGRSQIAAAILDHLSRGRVIVRSAGSSPASEINPLVVKAMSEIGLDLSKEFPKPITDDLTRYADVIVTMGCGDTCPIFPGKRYIDWEIDDPARKDIAAIRRIRDDIEDRVRDLLKDLDESAPRD